MYGLYFPEVTVTVSAYCLLGDFRGGRSLNGSVLTSSTPYPRKTVFNVTVTRYP
jgi:hypothetical protein